MTRHAILAVFVLAIPSAPLSGQLLNARVDVGTARMTFADSIDATSVSVAPAVWFVAPRGSLAASGTISSLGGSSTHSGAIDGSVTPFVFGMASTELAALAGGSSHSNGTRTGQMLGSVRLHIGGGARGAWVGGGLGRTWDGLWRDVLQADAGAWMWLGPSALVASIAPTVVDDTIRYADGNVSLHSELRAWEFDAALGLRAGQQIPSLPANRSIWGSLSAVFWATDRVGLVASAGSYPVDFTQGYPGGRYVSVSARLRSTPPAPRVAPGVTAARPGVSAFEVQRVSGDSHRIRVRAVEARQVELAGDFTQWTPVPLRAEGNGWWAATVRLPRGTHEVNVRINRGPWLVPPGTMRKSDEFGGAVGLLTVR